jgi:hypothetical protein
MVCQLYQITFIGIALGVALHLVAWHRILIVDRVRQEAPGFAADDAVRGYATDALPKADTRDAPDFAFITLSATAGRD